MKYKKVAGLIFLLGSMSLSAMENNDCVELSFDVANCSGNVYKYFANFSLTDPNIINITSQENQTYKITNKLEIKIERLQNNNGIILFYAIQKLYETSCNNYSISMCYTDDVKSHLYSMKSANHKTPLTLSKPSDCYEKIKQTNTMLIGNAYNAKSNYDFCTAAFKALKSKIDEQESNT